MRLRLEEGSQTLIKFDRARNRNRLFVGRVPKMLYKPLKGDGFVLCIYSVVLKVNHVYFNYDSVTVNRSAEPAQS